MPNLRKPGEKRNELTSRILERTGDLKQLATDLMNWLSTDDLQEFAEKNGYLEPDELDDETGPNESDDA